MIIPSPNKLIKFYTHVDIT